MRALRFAYKATFYLSVLCIVTFLLSIFFSKKELALIFLNLLLVFWGVNKVIAGIQGAEIRLTYAVKIPKEAPQIIRNFAMVFGAAIATYGAIELWKVSF